MASSSNLGFSFTPRLIRLLLTLLHLVPLISRVNCQTCKSQSFTSNKVYSNCLDLPSLSSYLHYTYDSSNSSISVAFVAPPAESGGWIAWAVNPISDGMVGAQSLIAYQESGGKVVVKTFVINSYSAVVESKLSFDVWNRSAEAGNGVLMIFAKLKVPASSSSVNYIWQVGPSVTNGVPDRHELQTPNLAAKGKLSLAGSQNGSTTTSSSVDSMIKRRNIHGILNAVSWGFLFPLGAMIARYMRTFESADPAWFYLHIFCQVSGYAIGVAGWATGMKLGGQSQGIVYSNHRNIGIALFSIATLQIFALLLRPKKEHKYRVYWNVYHHGLGYAILVLGILNVFKGLNILKPDHRWKSAYLIAIVVLGAISLLLEAITWVIVLRRKSTMSTKPYDGFNNGQGSQRPISI